MPQGGALGRAKRLASCIPRPPRAERRFYAPAPATPRRGGARRGIKKCSGAVARSSAGIRSGASTGRRLEGASRRRVQRPTLRRPTRPRAGGGRRAPSTGHAEPMPVLRPPHRPAGACRIAPSPQAGQKGGRRRRVEDATPAAPRGCRGPNARRGWTRGKRGSATAAEAPAPAQSRRRMRRPPRAPRGPARPDRPPKRPGARAGSFCSRKGRPRSAPAAAGKAPSRAAPSAP